MNSNVMMRGLWRYRGGKVATPLPPLRRFGADLILWRGGRRNRLKSLEGMNGYAWGAALLAFLYYGIGYRYEGTRTNLKGNHWIVVRFFLLRLSKLHTLLSVDILLQRFGFPFWDITWHPYQNMSHPPHLSNQLSSATYLGLIYCMNVARIECVVWAISRKRHSDIVFIWADLGFRATRQCDLRVEDGPRVEHPNGETRLTHGVSPLVMKSSLSAPWTPACVGVMFVARPSSQMRHIRVSASSGKMLLG
nr:hypothetical protein [Tanacetum cinerariifolium]